MCVYMLFFDGEFDEGFKWEVMMLVVYFGIDNFIVIVDVNN